MTAIDFSRRVPPKTLNGDITAYHGLGAIDGYKPTRNEATPKNLKIAYEAMLVKQQKETELTAKVKSASDDARQAEAAFHDAVLAMKDSIRGQFGLNSTEAQAVGYKRKSEYKRPRRRSA